MSWNRRTLFAEMVWQEQDSAKYGIIFIVCDVVEEGEYRLSEFLLFAIEVCVDNFLSHKLPQSLNKV